MRKAFAMICGLALVLASLVPVALAIIAPGPQAPDFTLTDIDGNTWTLSNKLGKRVLLSFFFTT